nr:hypothetical protein CFP56_02900 [Quercus suber]POF13881.1 hypothetical protein CFP56_02905 [Quercus suber]
MQALFVSWIRQNLALAKQFFLSIYKNKRLVLRQQGHLLSAAQLRRSGDRRPTLICRLERDQDFVLGKSFASRSGSTAPVTELARQSFNRRFPIDYRSVKLCSASKRIRER